MWHYHRSWKAFAEAIITVGVVFLVMGILFFRQLFTEDYLGVVILLVIGVVCTGAGTWIERWAKRNGKI